MVSPSGVFLACYLTASGTMRPMYQIPVGLELVLSNQKISDSKTSALVKNTCLYQEGSWSDLVTEKKLA